MGPIFLKIWMTPMSAEPLAATRRLGVVFFPAFDWAISATHPEREERLLYTRDQLQEEGLFDIPGISEYRPSFASHAQLARAHFCLPSVGAVSTDSPSGRGRRGHCRRASGTGKKRTGPLPWCVRQATTPCAWSTATAASAISTMKP